MKKILVTGGAGYIGSFMVRQLAEAGHEVVIVDNLSQGHKEAIKDFRLEQIDLVTGKDQLNQLFETEKFDGVIHMASFIQMGESFANPVKYYNNNLIGAINLFEVMVSHKVSNFILSSSAGVYGNPERLPIVEEDRKDPLNPYGETKYMLERMLSTLDKAYGFRFAAIRYFNAAGAALDGSIGEDHPSESHLIPLAIKAALNKQEFNIFGNDYQTPDGTCIRDYVHVLDLAEAHTKALEYLFNGGKSEYFNAGIGQGYSNKQVVDMINQVTGLGLQVKFGPRRAGDADSLYAANDKIKKVLGWQPQYGLKEIVESAFKWHSTHLTGYSAI
jgi:UDP-glucose 4-epimerase